MAVFFILIQILNILIAVLNDAYVDNKAEKINIYSQNQLKFVISKWNYKSLAFANIDSIKYIVTAFLHK